MELIEISAKRIIGSFLWIIENHSSDIPKALWAHTCGGSAVGLLMVVHSISKYLPRVKVKSIFLPQKETPSIEICEHCISTCFDYIFRSSLIGSAAHCW